MIRNASAERMMQDDRPDVVFHNQRDLSAGGGTLGLEVDRVADLFLP